ncbi:MAG: DUF4252 domain-containing protein [Prevotellaceae bacterium]|jgi:hypothetical protein|nr:DUF4252 domain-containing protein [Prevotellaceae bacterium]
MKKTFVILSVLFAVNQVIMAQSLESFIIDFAEFEGVEKQVIDLQMLTAAEKYVEDSTAIKKMNTVKMMEVFTAETPSEALRAKCVDFISKFTEDADYNAFIKMDKGNEKILIAPDKVEQAEKTLILFTVNEEIAIVKIKGDIDLSYLNNINI